MAKNVYFSNPARLEKLKKQIREEGIEKLHIISDFERTLTYTFVEGKKVPSIISVLRESGDYLGEAYAQKARELFDKYYPIEVDPYLPAAKKKKAMEEWWMGHFKLLIDSGLNKKHLEKVVVSGRIKFRKGALEFFDFLHAQKIPLIIMSASGLGSEAISMLLKKEGKLYPHIYIISNSLLWDKNGKAIGVKKPIVHSLNKDETLISKFPFYKRIKNRKNVLLLGDTLEDVGMVKGFAYNALIKIGFLNEKVKENLSHYKRVYDILILNDSSMDFVNHFLARLVV